MAVGTMWPWIKEISTSRRMCPLVPITSTSPWFGSTANKSWWAASMLYHVPSGSESSGSGFATGCAFWKSLRFAIRVQIPKESIRITPLFVPASPCEHPAPARIAYNLPSMNATSATPLTRLPNWALVWLDGRPSTRGEGPGVWTSGRNLLTEADGWHAATRAAISYVEISVWAKFQSPRIVKSLSKNRNVRLRPC